MLVDVVTLLGRLTQMFPPPKGQRHTLAIGDEEGELRLTIWAGETSLTFLLDESDIVQGADDLFEDARGRVEQMQRILAEPPSCVVNEVPKG